MRKVASFCAARGVAILLLLAGLSGTAQEAPCQTGDISLDFVSDAMWQVNAMNPDGGMGVLLGPAQCVCDVPGWPCGLTFTDLGDAQWIWMPGVTPASLADLQGAYFSKEFYLPGLPVSGSIRVAVDDFAEVRVNGAVVGSTGSVTDLAAAAAAQRTLVDFDLTPFMCAGLNTITIRAQNGPYWFSGYGCNPCNYTFTGNPAQLIFAGALTSAAPVSSSPQTWGRLKALYH